MTFMATRKAAPKRGLSQQRSSYCPTTRSTIWVPLSSRMFLPAEVSTDPVVVLERFDASDTPGIPITPVAFWLSCPETPPATEVAEFRVPPTPDVAWVTVPAVLPAVELTPRSKPPPATWP